MYIRSTVHIAHSACTSIGSVVKMKFSIVTNVLLGLLLTPALADYNWNTEGNQHSDGNHQVINMLAKQTPVIRKQFKVDGSSQTLTLNRQHRIATIQHQSTRGSWKTIWNYNLGTITTKVLPQRVCYISKVIRTEMPRFDELPILAEEVMKLQNQRQPAQEISFTIDTRVHDLKSYGQDIFALCRGLPTYVTHKVIGPQNPHSSGSCLTIDVLKLLGLQYCHHLDHIVKHVKQFETN